MEVLTTLPMPRPAIKEGQAPVPEDAWYTDHFCWDHLPTWRAIAYQPSTNSMRMEDNSGQNSQWAELRAIWIVIT